MATPWNKAARARLEAALIEREAGYRALFDNGFLGIATLTTEGRVKAVNRAFTRILGYDAQDLQETWLSRIVHPNHATATKKAVKWIQRRTSNDLHIETRYIGKNGDVIWTDTHFLAVRRKRGAPMAVQVIVEDITARKRMEAELKELNYRALEKEKTIQKLKSEFIFIAAHELRNPVTAIAWAVDLLKESRKDHVAAGEKDEVVGLLDENAKRLQALVAELLEVSRIEYGTFLVTAKRIVLPVVLERAALSVVRIAKGAGVRVRIMPIARDAQIAFADPARVHEVLVNLLTNAVKYNVPGGSVTVRVRRSGKDVHVNVEDTGIGMKEADLPKLFLRFSRLENEASHATGTGLGLFIVKEVVERMGGTVWARSAGEGKGSVFGFTLPVKA